LDSLRFDCLTRALATAPSRRDLTRVLTGLALGGGAAAARLADVNAKKCGPCKKKKHGKCKKKKPDDSPCNGEGKCLNGTCNQPPTCGGLFQFCFTDDECCSGDCPFNLAECRQGAADTPCHNAGDCLSNVCIGFRCQ
jgi:hypothetical protein